jgi:GNAT superfamily N-acetyltransferase
MPNRTIALRHYNRYSGACKTVSDHLLRQPKRGADMENLTITAVDVRCADAVGLIAGLDAELRPRYPDVDGRYAAANALADHTTFLVGYIAGQPIACGAFRPMDSEAAEIKRMFVQPAWRGRGVARRLLAELERLARAAGHSVARLETGIDLHNAVRLYEAAGYRRIAKYGIYAGNADSVCFEKAL